MRCLQDQTRGAVNTAVNTIERAFSPRESAAAGPANQNWSTQFTSFALGRRIYRRAVLLLLALITHAVGKPTAVERCIDDRLQQVLDSHQLKRSQLTASVRVSEVTKATNFCNGGNGRLNWTR